MFIPAIVLRLYYKWHGIDLMDLTGVGRKQSEVVGAVWNQYLYYKDSEEAFEHDLRNKPNFIFPTLRRETSGGSKNHFSNAQIMAQSEGGIRCQVGSIG